MLAWPESPRSAKLPDQFLGLGKSALKDALALKPEELEKVDVALMNFVAADGLVSKAAVSDKMCMDFIDWCANLVAARTAEKEDFYTRDPGRFENSKGYFKMHLLADVLVNEVGLRYDPLRVPASEEVEQARIERSFFSDPKVIFVHGLLQPPHFGTCASLPVIYVAVARRLHYPVSLAATEEHLYVRYDEPNGDHFNVEATAISHFKTPPDEYYRNECRNRTEQEIAEAGWLRPLTASEAFGHFLLSRIACLSAAGRRDEALETCELAARYLPKTDIWKKTLEFRKAQLRDDAFREDLGTAANESSTKASHDL